MAFGLGGRTSYSAARRPPFRRIVTGSSTPVRAYGARSCLPRMKSSATLNARTRPSRCRSSGTYATPRARGGGTGAKLLELATDHGPCDLGWIGIPGDKLAGIAPASQDRDVVGDRHDLAKLVGDEDERLSLVAERPYDCEELVDLLW